MNIKRLVIENFKSIERIELIEPNPFTVFVGPNGSGKSNIFEALEFVNVASRNESAPSYFGGLTNIVRRTKINETPDFKAEIDLCDFIYEHNGFYGNLSFKKRLGDQVSLTTPEEMTVILKSSDFQQFKVLFRLFIGNKNLLKFTLNDDKFLALDASNLEKVLKRLLANILLQEEIFEWLNLFIPGFKAVEVDDRDELHWFEKGSNRYFTKDLISDGTYNILALLTAVYQSDEPQFLCVEEPENGLHPEVLESLVNFFRNQCIEKGHYIWLNTHSESIVKLLTTDEIILVNKRDGATQTKQVKGMNMYSLTTDEAWLSGALGGGLAW